MAIREYITLTEYFAMLVSLMGFAFAGRIVHHTVYIYNGIDQTALKIIIAFNGMLAFIAAILSSLMLILWVVVKVLHLKHEVEVKKVLE